MKRRSFFAALGALLALPWAGRAKEQKQELVTGVVFGMPPVGWSYISSSWVQTIDGDGNTICTVIHRFQKPAFDWEKDLKK